MICKDCVTRVGIFPSFMGFNGVGINIRIPDQRNALKIFEDIFPGEEEYALFLFFYFAFANWLLLTYVSVSWTISPRILELNGFAVSLVEKYQYWISMVQNKSTFLWFHTMLISWSLFILRHLFDPEA